MPRAPIPEGKMQTLLRRRRIATLPELKKALGTCSTMTVFRHLKRLGYRTSYSHRGKFYTLGEIAKFDADGLWCCRSVWFSRYGSLLETARAFVERSEAGYSAGELEALLHVEVKGAVLELWRRKMLCREEIGGRYVYFAESRGRRDEQKKRRRQVEAAREWGVWPWRGEVEDELKAAVVLFHSLLDEKQRRLYAGLESFKLGRGGDRRIAAILGMDAHTVGRGRRELLSGEVERGRVRRRGGGRKPVEKKRRR